MSPIPQARTNLPAQTSGSPADTVQGVEADDLRPQDTVIDAEVDSVLADRLDALEAERVMQRALELEAESADEPRVLTAAQLERVASEIGVDSSFVRQALLEMRNEAPEQGRIASWLLGETLAESTKLTGMSRAEVDATVTKWMTQHEGLIAGGAVPGGVEWHVDRRWRTQAVARSRSGGNRISRVAGGDITHRVHTVSDDEHVVMLLSEGRWPRTFATLLLSVGGTLNALMLLGATVTNELLIGLGAFVGIAIGLGTIAVGGARWWARGIKGALRRSLIGLAESAKQQRTSWLSRRPWKRDAWRKRGG